MREPEEPMQPVGCPWPAVLTMSTKSLWKPGRHLKNPSISQITPKTILNASFAHTLRNTHLPDCLSGLPVCVICSLAIASPPR